MSRWSASWRVAARIARRDAVRSRGRTALVAAMIGLPVFVGAAGGTLLQSTYATPERRMTWELADGVQARIGEYEARGIVQAPDSSTAIQGNDDEPTPTLAQYEADLAAAIPPGTHLVRGTVGFGELSHGDVVLHDDAQVEEYPADGIADVVVAPVAQGRLPDATGQVALSAPLAQQIGVGVGDEVGLAVDKSEPVPMTVTGVLRRWPSGPGVVAVQGAVLDEPPDAHGLSGSARFRPYPQWYVVGDAPVTWDDVQKINALGSMVTSRAVVLDPPPMPAELATTNGGPDVAQVGVAAGVAAIALIEAALMIGPAFAVGARRSQRQLALLAASGGDRRAMRRVVLAGGLVTSLAASVAGAVVGVALAAAVQWVTSARGSSALPDLRVPWLLLAGLVVLGCLIGTAAAAVPARRASRVDVVAALAGRRAESAPHPAVPVVGAVTAGLGVVAALVGATIGRPVLLVAGIVVLLVGVVLASGGIVSLVARLAPHLGPAGRFAVRDAARQRGRTAPALAAVIAALAGVSAALVYVASNEHHDEASNETLGVPGTVTVGTGWMAPGTPEASADDVARAHELLRSTLPVADVAVVHVAVPPHEPVAPPEDDGAGGPSGPVYVGGSGGGAIRLEVVRAPDQECPLSTDAPDRPSRLTQVDARCVVTRNGAVMWSEPDTDTKWLVDDGTAVRLLGTPEAARAADALAAGKVVVRSEHDLQPDGTVRVEVRSYDDAAGTVTTLATADLPAAVVDLDNYDQLSLVLPPSAAEPLGLTTRVAGLVASTTAMSTHDDIAAANDEIDCGAWNGGVYVQPASKPMTYLLWILVAAAFVIGIGATGLAVALSAAESRPDLATLGAVGAAPRTRRRIAAAQAAVLVVTGTVLGVATGVVLGRVLVTMQRMGGLLVDPAWTTVIPWPWLVGVVAGVPLLAMGGAWALTRSRLPMVRRVVG
jgi:putative ABC transport system permease protein